jgi:Egg-laying hormone precursor
MNLKDYNSMSDNGLNEKFKIGFLTAVQVEGGGYVGGLLVTNHFGRPLEFQCTTPVKPNKSQEILYGPTLVPYMLSDLIGKTLVEKVNVKPHIVLTEQPELLSLRENISIPVGCISKEDSSSEEENSSDLESSEETRLQFGKQKLRFHSSHQQDRQIIENNRNEMIEEADLTEPFERIRVALNETMNIAVAQ